MTLRPRPPHPSGQLIEGGVKGWNCCCFFNNDVWIIYYNDLTNT